MRAAGANARVEGDDATASQSTPTVRLSNYCQISSETASVSGTQQAVESAGRDDELAYQEMLKGLELKRDMEFILLANTAKSAGNSSTARNTASVLSWIKTNTNKSTGTTTGVDPTAADGTSTRVDGTQRTFTEAMLKDVLKKCFDSGGKPDTIMTGSFNKQVFSTFTGRSTPTEDAKSKKIVASVKFYDSDFGELQVVPNLFMRSRDVLVLQMDMWALSFLNGRKMVSIPLAVTGDSRKREVLSEYALTARTEKASGGVFDLTTS